MTAAPSLFEDVELAPPVPVFQLTAQCREDPAQNKINLGVGGLCIFKSNYIEYFQEFYIGQLNVMNKIVYIEQQN